MANFLVIVDPDRERRTAFVTRASESLAPFEWLSSDGFKNGSFQTRWAAGPRAPIDFVSGPEGAAVVWGEAIDGTRVSAQGVLNERSNSGLPPARDGFFAACRYRPGEGLEVSGDILGLFPIYYASTSEVVIAASSPGAILGHPLMTHALDVEGLIGTLLVELSVGGRTLWSGIRRLGPGRALIWAPGGVAGEVTSYEVPVSDRSVDVPMRRQIDRLDEVLVDATRRHAGTAGIEGVLLSGGLDSRLLLGYAADIARPERALTLGRPSDFEARAAGAVAAEVGCDHRTQDLVGPTFTTSALLHTRYDHLGSGVNTLHNWGGVEWTGSLGRRCLAGYVADTVLGGTDLQAPGAPPVGFDRVFRNVNRRGIDRELLSIMLLPSYNGGRVDTVVESMRDQYEQLDSRTADAVWRWRLTVLDRLHGGSVPWRMSFGSWPVMPFLDRAVLEIAATLPAETLANRRAQGELIRGRFPRLARIPHVQSNAGLVMPLQPTASAWTRHGVGSVVASLERRFRRSPPERRFGWRMHDFDGPGWQGIRQMVEPVRDGLGRVLDPGVVDRYLPAPGETLGPETWGEPIGRKLLCILALWLDLYLPDDGLRQADTISGSPGRSYPA